MKELAPAGELFRRVLKDNPALYTLLRTSSAGLVVNEAIRDTPPGEKYRDISGKEWYMAPRQSMDSFYGEIVELEGKIVQHIGLPIKITTPENKIRFGGVLLAVLDLDYLIRTYAQHNKRPFRIILDKKELYSRNWNDTCARIDNKIIYKGQKSLTLQLCDSLHQLWVEQISEKAEEESNEISSLYSERKKDVGNRTFLDFVRMNRNALVVAAVGLIAILILAAVLLALKKSRSLENDENDNNDDSDLERERQREGMREALKNKLKEELRKEIQENYYNEIFDREKKKLEQRIKETVSAKETDAVYALEKEDLHRRIREEIQNNEKVDIYRKIYDEIAVGERRRIEEHELEGIIENEKKRLLDQEGPKLRKEFEERIYREEVGVITGKIKKRVADQHKEEIMLALVEHEENIVRERVSKKWDELSGKCLHECRQILDETQKIAVSLKSVKSLESLEEMLEILNKQKRQFKYFNLDSAATSQLLTFLGNICTEMSGQFDFLDSSIKSAVMRVNSLLNHVVNKEDS
ncbi:MAG: hypothetical protein GF401_00965 [Chitinivibrionales bacterium]|nr:hypothetical protein [Chitinivibrionales bacterium]